MCMIDFGSALTERLALNLLSRHERRESPGNNCFQTQKSKQQTQPPVSAENKCGEPGDSGFLPRGTFWRGASTGQGATEGRMQRPEFGDGEVLGTWEAELQKEGSYIERGWQSLQRGSLHSRINTVLHTCSGNPTRPGSDPPGELHDSQSLFRPGIHFYSD